MPVLRKKEIFIVLGVWLAIVDFFVLTQISNLTRILVAGSFVLLIPGWTILSLLFQKLLFNWRFAFYSIGLSLSSLIFVGLGFNSIAPLFGVHEPLTPVAVLIFFNAILLSLWVILYRRIEVEYCMAFPQFNYQTFFILALSFILPILSVVGTIILNNNGQNYVTIGMIVGVGVLIGLVIALRKSLMEWIYPIIIYGSSLALLFMYSMRSAHIMGWDINLEYQVFRLTELFSHWSTTNLPGAEYNACLSLTILPTLLHIFVGGESEYVFKFFMQMIFAIVPVGIFLLCRRYIDQSLAFLAAILYASQPWFIEQMPALIRQEIAFVFLIVALCSVFDDKLPVRVRNILFGISSFSIVVSHYSTTYVWIATLSMTLVLVFVSRYLFKPLKYYRTSIDYRIIIATLIFAFIWNSQLTKTSESLGDFMGSAFSRMSEIFTMEALRSGSESIGFRDTTESASEALKNDYEKTYTLYTINNSPESFYSFDRASYEPKFVDDRVYTESMIPEEISPIVLLISTATKFLLVNVFSIVGLILFGMLSIFEYSRRKRSVPFDYIAFCASSFPLIFLVVIFPYVQEKYNLTRLFMQSLIVLVLPIIQSLSLLAGFFRWATPIIVAVPIIVFLFNSSGLTQHVSGDLARITLQQPGGKYDSFYTYDSEIRSAHWLSKIVTSEDTVYADIIASLRLQGFADLNNVNLDLFPPTIFRDSYVYLSYANLHRDVVYRHVRSFTAGYETPIDFLNQNKDKIYSNGGSDIYR